MFANKILPMKIVQDYCEFFMFGKYLVFVYSSNDIIFDFEGELELASFILN